MFERFSRSARMAVVDARDVAVRAQAIEIDAEHLLLALRTADDSFAGWFLASRLPDSVELADEFSQIRRRGGVSDADAAALGELGIDVDKIVDAVEHTHGTHALAGDARGWRRWCTRGIAAHIPFSQAAKGVLKQALQEAIALGDRHIGTEHLLLALIDYRGAVADLLAEHEIDYLAVRRALAEPKAS